MRELGILMSGVFAAVAGVAGIVWLGMTGLVWHDGRLTPGASYDASEAGIGIGAMAFFGIVGAALLLLAIVSSLRQAAKQLERKAYFHRLSWLVPLIVMGLVAVLWPILLGAGGASFAP